MTVSRCIMVLSTLRAGSSCVAGALHRLGVDMGEGHFQPADKNNRAGYHEDLRWQAITKRITGGRYYHDSFQPDTIPDEAAAGYALLAQDAQTRAIWGIKSPRMAFTAHWVWPLLEDCRIVVMHRPRAQSIASLIRHSELGYPPQYHLTEDEAADIIDRHLDAVERRLTEFSGPVLHVDYNELLDCPAYDIGRLASFCFAGLRRLAPDHLTIGEVADWIDPELNHHRGIM